jgi:hypothetical protein
MEPNLATINLELGILAAVSVLEGLVIIGAGIAGFVLYRRVSDLLATLEARHVAPVMAQVNAILQDVRDVTFKVKEDTDRIDQAIRATMDRVDDTADRVRSNLRIKTSRIVGFVRGVRVVIDELMTTKARTNAA